MQSEQPNLDQTPNPSTPPVVPPAPPQSSQPGQPPTQQSGYKKKPLWFWVGVYLAIAAIVYGIVYWVFYR